MNQRSSLLGFFEHLFSVVLIFVAILLVMAVFQSSLTQIDLQHTDFAINYLANQGYTAWAAGDGDVVITGDATIGGDLLPSTDEASDLGTIDSRWRDAFIYTLTLEDVVLSLIHI